MEICIDMLSIWGCRGVGDLQVTVLSGGHWCQDSQWQGNQWQGQMGQMGQVTTGGLWGVVQGVIVVQHFARSGWLIDWLISSRRSLLCSFYCHIASGGLGTRWHLGVFGWISCRTVDQISMLYATYLPAWEHVLGDWQILWAKAMETTEPPATESGLDSDLMEVARQTLPAYIWCIHHTNMCKFFTGRLPWIIELPDK